MLAVRITKETFDLVSRETQYPVERLSRGYRGWYCLSDEGHRWSLISPKEFVLNYRFTQGSVSNRFAKVVKR